MKVIKKYRRAYSSSSYYSSIQRPKAHIFRS